MSVPTAELACPICGHRQSLVLDARGITTRTRIRRRRRCLGCDGLFTTREVVDPRDEAEALAAVDDAEATLERIKRRRAA